MATDAIVVPVSRQQPIYRPINRTAERVFYTGMAILLCAVTPASDSMFSAMNAGALSRGNVVPTSPMSAIEISTAPRSA